MTDRMRTIAETFARQAGMVKILEQHAHEYGAGTFEDTEYPELEKFAELIVQHVLACVRRWRLSVEACPETVPWLETVPIGYAKILELRNERED